MLSSSLPAPSSETKDPETTTGIKLDALGPMVVNTDGTLSRITNWPNMTEIERQRTLKTLAARNKLRLAAANLKGDDKPETPADASAQ